MMIFSFFLGLVALGFFMLFRKFRFQGNDTDSSLVSLLSPQTFLSQNWKHSVFPSFHGVDVRKTILSHILAAFKRKGIYPFIDNDIDKSKSIGPELKEAIRGSKIAVVLLSKNYSSSSWCLDELAEIIKCREVLGQIVMTIFYEVDPTDIKKQAGDFGKAFRKTCKGKTKEHIERWRKALEDVATIAGEHSRNWTNEAAMIEKLATDVSNMLTISMPSRDFEDYVGMRAHMERMESLLCLDSDEVRMVGIWGPPGIGKSTIARVVFNELSSIFQHGAIMVNVKECYPRPCLDAYNVQLKLQNQMLSQIISQENMKISHLGVAKELLKDKKVLLVIDEVDRLGQLDALAKEISWFGFGSRIIVTTEDRSLLKAHGINHIYRVEFPSSDEAFQIFCMHAFSQKHPDDGFYELARKVSNLAGELPLGLKVLGSALRAKSKQEWDMILPRLKTSLDGEKESVIKFSYDALCDEDKYLFLYIASCFNYELLLQVEELLPNQFSNVRQGFHTLTEKSLITISEFGRIVMHSLIEQFGRETSRKQFIYNSLAKRQLLVNERDINEVLSDDTMDSNPFIGINVKFFKRIEGELNISDKTLEKMADLQFIKVKWSLLSAYEISRWESVLQNLIFHSAKIRSLIWYYFQNIYLPSTFNTEFLVKLDLPYSNLQKLWEDNKWMNLRSSEYLKELPDLSTATKLEELFLGSCKRLVELPSSIGTAINLQRLDLNGCSSLVKLPSSIGNLNNLVEINLCGCSKLEAFPTNINLKSLATLDLTNCSQLKSFPEISTNIKHLNLKGTAINEIPLTIMLWPRLWKLNLKDCNNLVSLPQISDSLSYLDASNCKSLERLDCSFNNRGILLMFPNCFKLNQEARDLIMRTSTRKFAVLPGTELPSCFNCRATAGGLLKIKLNETPLHPHLRFKACITLVKNKGEEETIKDGKRKYVWIDITEKQIDNNTIQRLRREFHMVDCFTEHIYIIEAVAEKVTSTELRFEFRIDSKKWKIGECGLMNT